MASKKKGGLSHFLYQTEKGKTIVNMAMSIGASVVIVGALFKIQHYPGAGAMLVIGLLTEAALFAIGAIEPQHVVHHFDWSKVYPELGHHEEESEDFEDEEDGEEHTHELDSDLPVTQQLDNMLEEAKIGPELIESLGEGLRGLSKTSSDIADISNASAATSEYVDNVKMASGKVGELADKYESAANALTSLSDASDSGNDIGGHMNSIAKNLEALNAVYEMQLKGTNEQLESSSAFFKGMNEMLENLNQSVEDAKSYRQNISELSDNIGALNTVYGNMLTAMNINKG